jgi:hypothetical protein
MANFSPKFGSDSKHHLRRRMDLIRRRLKTQQGCGTQYDKSNAEAGQRIALKRRESKTVLRMQCTVYIGLLEAATVSDMRGTVRFKQATNFALNMTK